MLKKEFERLAMRNDEEVSQEIFDTIHLFYMATNNYHVENGGIEETKSEFVKRVFGGKRNTTKTIALRMSAERIRENDYCVGYLNSYEENQRMAKALIEQTCAQVAGFNAATKSALQRFVEKNLVNVSYIKNGKKQEFVVII